MARKDPIVEEVHAAREAIAKEAGYDLDRIIEPIRDRVIANYLYLSNTKGSILVGIIAFGPWPFAEPVDKIHDSSSLRSAFRHRIEKINVQVNLVRSHARLFFVEALFEFFRL